MPNIKKRIETEKPEVSTSKKVKLTNNKNNNINASPKVDNNKKVTTSQPIKQQQQPIKQQQQPVKQQQTTKQQQQPKSIIKKPKQIEKVEKVVVEKEQPKKLNKSFNQIISVGCYENSIMGFEANYVADVSQDEGFEVDLQMIFGYSAHTGCIKGLASCKNFLVSSSTDETSKVYNLSTRSEVGQLLKHEGFITTMEFYKNTYLFAGSMDNTISVWRVSDWECLKVMSGPKGAINSISIHPSGKAALSVSKDRRLFLWDLTKGTSAHFLKFKTEAFNVQWSPSGEQYACVFKDKVVIYDSNNFEEISSYDFKLQILTIKFFDDNTLLVGGEDKVVSFINLKTKKIVKVLQGHENRIKAIDILTFKEYNKKYIVTISSDGLVLIWNIDLELPVGMAETGFRLTTLSIGHAVSMEEKSDDEDDGEQEIDEDDEDDEEDREAAANQTIKKMKLNVEMEDDGEEDDDEDEEYEDEEEEEDE